MVAMGQHHHFTLATSQNASHLLHISSGIGRQGGVQRRCVCTAGSAHRPLTQRLQVDQKSAPELDQVCRATGPAARMTGARYGILHLPSRSQYKRLPRPWQCQWQMFSAAALLPEAMSSSNRVHVHTEYDALLRAF